MKIIDRIALALFSMLLAMFSLFIILIPFNVTGIFSISNVVYMIGSMEGNYYYTIVGILLFALSIRFLFSGIIGNKKDENNSFLVMKNEFGEVIIYSHTIVGLVQNAADKFSGINEIKTSVILTDGQVEVEMKGDVSPEINIPEVTRDLQALVKEHIENATGAIVREIKVKINNVTPNKVYK